MGSNVGELPCTTEEIQRWLEGLLSKQYDTEETAVHAVERYRDAVKEALLAEAGDIERRRSDECEHFAAEALRNFARELGGAHAHGLSYTAQRDASDRMRADVAQLREKLDRADRIGRLLLGMMTEAQVAALEKAVAKTGGDDGK